MIDRNDYVMGGGQWWTPPVPKKLAELDQSISEGINGDDGGTWTNTSPLAIGGAGLYLSDGPSQLLGGVRTGRGYGASSKPRIVLEATTWPAFVAPRARTIVVLPTPTPRTSAGDRLRRRGDGAFYADSPTGSGLAHTFFLPQLRIHNGAVLTSATFRWQLLKKPLSVPATPEQFAIFRCANELAGYAGLGAAASMHSNGLSGGVQYSSGFAYTNYGGNLEAYWNDGLVKSLTFAPDTNATIDTDQYAYRAYVESADPIAFHGIELTFTSITDQRFE